MEYWARIGSEDNMTMCHRPTCRKEGVLLDYSTDGGTDAVYRVLRAFGSHLQSFIPTQLPLLSLFLPLIWLLALAVAAPIMLNCLPQSIRLAFLKTYFYSIALSRFFLNLDLKLYINKVSLTSSSFLFSSSLPLSLSVYPRSVVDPAS